MVVSGRIQFIREQVRLGTSVMITILPSACAGRCKVKLAIDPHAPQISSASQTVLLASLTSIESLIDGAVAVDRGHRHSDGRSSVHLWISRLTESSSEQCQVDPEPKAAQPDSQNASGNETVFPPFPSVSFPKAAQPDPDDSEGFVDVDAAGGSAVVEPGHSHAQHVAEGCAAGCVRPPGHRGPCRDAMLKVRFDVANVVRYNPDARHDANRCTVASVGLVADRVLCEGSPPAFDADSVEVLFVRREMLCEQLHGVKTAKDELERQLATQEAQLQHMLAEAPVELHVRLQTHFNELAAPVRLRLREFDELIAHSSEVLAAGPAPTGHDAHPSASREGAEGLDVSQ
jgi:hypothetical protein